MYKFTKKKKFRHCDKRIYLWRTYKFVYFSAIKLPSAPFVDRNKSQVYPILAYPPYCDCLLTACIRTVWSKQEWMIYAFHENKMHHIADYVLLLLTKWPYDSIVSIRFYGKISGWIIHKWALKAIIWFIFFQLLMDSDHFAYDFLYQCCCCCRCCFRYHSGQERERCPNRYTHSNRFDVAELKRNATKETTSDRCTYSTQSSYTKVSKNNLLFNAVISDQFRITCFIIRMKYISHCVGNNNQKATEIQIIYIYLCCLIEAPPFYHFCSLPLLSMCSHCV